MTATERLASLIQQAFDGDQSPDTGWHGPSVSGLLRDLTAQEALTPGLPGTHSIWELVLHMSFWDDVCVRRLKGERLSVTTGSRGDWPDRVGTSAHDWAATLASSHGSRQSLVAAVRSLRDDDLERVVPDWGWTYETMIHGTLHHDLYHAGQIALIRAGLKRTAG
jgi:hypothetical protein